MKKQKNRCHECLYRWKPILCPFTDFVRPEPYDNGNVLIYIGYIGYSMSTVLKEINMKGHCGNLRLKRGIPKELLARVRDWLDGNGGREFFTLVKKEHGRVDACWSEATFPYSVHFNEGMRVRNFIRSTGIVDDWNCCDLDDMWVEIVEKSLGI